MKTVSKMIHIGGNNYINRDKISSVLVFNTQPVKRMIDMAEEDGILFDITRGKTTRSVIVLDNGQIYLSPRFTDTIIKRMEGKEVNNEVENESDEDE